MTARADEAAALADAIRDALGQRGDMPARRGAARARLLDPPVPIVPGRARQSRENLLVAVQVKLEAAGVTVLRVRRAGVAEAVAAWAGAPLPAIGCEADAWLAGCGFMPGNAEPAQVKVRRADALVAESATLIIDRALPEAGVVAYIVTLADVVGSLEAALHGARLAAGREISLITPGAGGTQRLAVVIAS